jgi:uncharacterized protein YggE
MTMPDFQELAGRRRAHKAAGAVLLLAALLCAPMGGVAAHTATPAASLTAGMPLVTVSGHGETNVPPDIAQVAIGVDVTKDTLQAAQQEATARANQILDTVKDAGVTAQDIQTINYNVSVLTDTGKNADRTEVKGFEIVNQVQVTVRDIAKLGELLDAVVQAGANTIDGVTFTVDDPTEAARQARIDAVTDAHAKASELAAAAGMTLGPVVSIAEGTAPPVITPFAADAEVAMKSAPVPVEIGSNTVSVDVTVTYQLR